MAYRGGAGHSCPVCKDAVLNESKGFGLRSFRCRVCHGRFLTWPEVDRQLEARGVRSRKRLFIAARSAQHAPGSRLCPFCERPLVACKVARVGSGRLFDRCAEHGLWFDYNELEVLLRDAVTSLGL